LNAVKWLFFNQLISDGPKRTRTGTPSFQPKAATIKRREAERKLLSLTIVPIDFLAGAQG
jgi:hypothetical protein